MNPNDSQSQERKSIEALKRYRLKSDLARAIQVKKLQGTELKTQQEMIDALRDYRGASEVEYLQDMTDTERSAIQEVMDFRRRQNEIIHDEEVEDVEELGKTWKDVLTESTKGALAGLSVGQIADTIMPREQLDAMSEVREAYIRTYGSQNDYKEIKKNLYTHLREVNKMLGVSAFSGSDIADGMKQAIIAGVAPALAESFAMSAALLKKVGVDLGDQTASAMAAGFGDTATDVMSSLANVMAGTKLFDEVKAGIVEATADIGVYIQQWSKTPEQLERSAGNYAAALGKINEAFILDTDQVKALQDVMIKATTGDTEAMVQLATLGGNVSKITSNIKKGDWGSAFQDVLSGISRLPKNSEALKAMNIGFDDKDIRQIQNRGSEISKLGQLTREAYQESTIQVDGLTKAEIRAKEIAESSMADRIHNWLTLNPIVEKASEILEKMNINASTASTIIGGTAGAAKGLFDTFLLMKMAKVPIPKSLVTLGPKLAKIGGVVTKLAKPFMKIGPLIVKAGAALVGFVGAAPIGTILAIVGAVTAVATVATVLYKNWDKVSAWFGKKWDWMKQKVMSFKTTVADVVTNVKEKFSVVTDPLTKALGKVKDAFSPIKTAMDNTFDKLKQKIQPAIDLFTAFKDKIVSVFQAVFSPIKSVIDKITEIVSPIAKVGEVVTKIKSFFGFGAEKPAKTTNVTATTASNTKTATQVVTKDGTKVKATELLNSMNARKTVDGIQDTNALLKNILIVLMEQNKTKLTVGDLVLD